MTIGPRSETSLQFESFATADLGPAALDSIIQLKSQEWPYPDQSQRQWFATKTYPDDLHVLMRLGETLVGYVRLVSAQVRSQPVRLIDTVVIDRARQRQGLGIKLMEQVHNLAACPTLLSC